MVRYLIVCDDVVMEKARPNLIGVVSVLRTEAGFPMILPQLCVYLQLTECRRSGIGHIEIQFADTGEAVIRSQDHAMKLSRNPIEIVSATFRLKEPKFDRPGLYWFRFWLDGRMLHQQPVVTL